MTDTQPDPSAEPGGDMIGGGTLPGGLGAPAVADAGSEVDASDDGGGFPNPFDLDDSNAVSEVDAPAGLSSTTDPTLDSDGDGHGNLDEEAVGTDPFESDSDGDGIGDGEEAWIGTDPFEVDNPDYSGQEGVDSDGDGLSDAVEDAQGYDPDS